MPAHIKRQSVIDGKRSHKCIGVLDQWHIYSVWRSHFSANHRHPPCEQNVPSLCRYFKLYSFILKEMIKHRMITSCKDCNLTYWYCILMMLCQLIIIALHICYVWWTCFSTDCRNTYGFKLDSSSRRLVPLFVQDNLHTGASQEKQKC